MLGVVWGYLWAYTQIEASKLWESYVQHKYCSRLNSIGN